jgi:Sap, sulfolipid-1-addressing protein
MSNLWGTLAPLIIGSAVVPVQIIITILLLRSASGKKTAVAWVVGMTTVRVLQGVIFGLVLSSDDVSSADPDATSPITGTLLLVVGVLFLVMALRQAMNEPDPDAPPPKWLTMTATMGPKKAFLLGAGVMLIGVKFWVFTLSALSAIGDADLGRSSAVLTFIAFVLLASSINIAVLAVSFIVPNKADALLTRASASLQKHNRIIMIVLGVVFGTWFVVKGLTGLGVI